LATENGLVSTDRAGTTIRYRELDQLRPDLGLTEEEFNLGWVARYTSRDTEISLQLMTRDATAPEDPVISVKVDDVGAAYAQAQERGYEIVHPLATEEWGVTRFFVRVPDGNVLNVAQHRD